jgi:hypothetical protein
MIICSSSSDVSDMYNNLKAAWDSLMAQGFRVAITVVLEELKMDELKRKSAEPKK